MEYTPPPTPESFPQFRKRPLPNTRRLPTRFQASAAGLDLSNKVFPTTPITFWLNTRHFPSSPSSSPLLPYQDDPSDPHPNILSVSLPPSPFATTLQHLAAYLPAPVSHFLAHRLIPEWFLPSRVILKQRRRDTYADEDVHVARFTREVDVYERLGKAGLQGAGVGEEGIVPRMYGRTHFEGRDAIVLQEVPGMSLRAPEMVAREWEGDLEGMVRECYEKLVGAGGWHEEAWLENLWVVPGGERRERVVVVGLGGVRWEGEEERFWGGREKGWWVEGALEGLGDVLGRLQKGYWQDGWLEELDD
ncbi:hypothetical protein B0J18DRAFT_459302 [Chaetomium sp. MPI-SDFR-AT-0129]|nr:hypothetical protein B0J18DRAFT_459302 [Chaetomium sp. MPI-SDFR-AT-0129]